MRLRLAGLVVAGCLLAPAAASASSVRMVRTTASNGRGTDITKTITYRAAAGEANRLTVNFLGSTGPEGSATRRYSVIDSGATISAGAGCIHVSAHRADCSSSDEAIDVYDSVSEAVDAQLLDGNDSGASGLDQDTDTSSQGGVEVKMDGGSGDDVLWAPNTFATLNGGRGSDRIIGSDRTDFLDGGGGGRDEIHGGDQPDFITDGDSSSAPDADVLDGGANPSSSGPGDDNGDTVSYRSRTRKVSVDLAAGRGGQAGEGDQLQNIEDVEGGRAGDSLRGDARVNVLSDGADAGRRPGDKDRLSGRGGDDLLVSTAGRDRLDGGTGGDELSCAGRRKGHSCRLSGGAGNDLLEGGRGNDRLSGGSGKDSLSGGRGKDRLVGGSGRDKLNGGSGRDKLFSRDHSRDRVNGGSGRDSGKADRRDRVKSVERLSRR
jgi:Ca2+-binding RTX toxin-like protein